MIRKRNASRTQESEDRARFFARRRGEDPFDRLLFSLMKEGQLHFPRAAVYPEDQLLDAGPAPFLDDAPAPRGLDRVHERLCRWHPALGRPWMPAAATLLLLACVSGSLGLYTTEQSKMAYVPSEERTTRAAPLPSGMAERPSDRMLQYFYDGEARLRESQVWKFRRVNRAKLEAALVSLESARRLAEGQGLKDDQVYLAYSYYYLGKGYLKRGEYARAREPFERLLQMDSKDAPQSVRDLQSKVRPIVVFLSGHSTKRQ